MILKPVSGIVVTKLNSNTAAELASERVISKQRRGRHAVTIKGSGSGIYIGGDNTVSTTTGYKIAADEVLTIPMNTLENAPLFFVGEGTLLEYF